MKFASRVIYFSGAGFVLTLTVAGLASLSPGVFGWLTIPLWVLPGLAGFGAHDLGIFLMLISGTMFYGLASFIVFRVLQVSRRRGDLANK